MPKTELTNFEYTFAASVAAYLAGKDKYKAVPFYNLVTGVRAGYWLALVANRLVRNSQVPRELLAPVSDPSWRNVDMPTCLSLACRSWVNDMKETENYDTLDYVVVVLFEQSSHNDFYKLPMLETWKFDDILAGLAVNGKQWFPPKAA